jgi:MFS family permease
MILGAGLYLLGFGSYGWTDSAPLYVVAMILVTAGEMLVIPAGQAMTALLAPSDMRARYVATDRFNWIIAQSLGPLAASVIMDRYDPRWVWYGCSIICAISMVGFYGLYRATKDRLGAKDKHSVAAVLVPAQSTPAENP